MTEIREACNRCNTNDRQNNKNTYLNETYTDFYNQ